MSNTCKILFILKDGNDICRMTEAFHVLEQEAPGRVASCFYDSEKLDHSPELLAECMENMEKADGIILHIHGGSAYFREFPKICTCLKNKPYFYWSGMEDENREMQKNSALMLEDYQIIQKYFESGGIENSVNLLKYLSSRLKGFPEDYAQPVFPSTEGILELKKEKNAEELSDNHPVIGILVHYSDVKTNNLRHICALADSIRLLGAEPLVVYSNIVADETAGSLGLRHTLYTYFQKDGKTCIDALVVTCGFSMSILSSPGDGSKRVTDSVFESLDVPVIQALTTYYSYEKWKQSWQGVDPSVLNSNVYQTEFDGQLLSVPFACTERIYTEFGEQQVSMPIPDRVEKLARLTVNWAILHRLPAKEIRVAIILHNMPPTNDRIGCVYGLDAAASLYDMLVAMKENGIQTDFSFQSGEDIIKGIQSGLTNDNGYLSEQEMLRRCADTIDEERYGNWFEEFPQKNQEELERDWGDAPGTFFTAVDGGQRKILVPGLLSGNLFIGLQPPRAREEQAEKAYHSADVICPHQYLAFYRWVEKVFQANVIVHLGTHGTLEWLPGKSIGLSQECYPDLAIDTLPHLYPYIINVPGEGMQAKRRTCAAVIDHLIPSMKESGLYQELEGLDERIDARRHALLGDSGKLPVLEKEIWELACELHLQEILKIDEEQYRNHVAETLEIMQEWLDNVRHTMIKDGFHIFGRVPEGERLLNLIRLMVRIPNGQIPSLSEAIKIWKDNSGTEKEQDSSVMDRQMDMLEINILKSMEESGWQADQCLEVAEKTIGSTAADKMPLLSCMKYICREVVPAIKNTGQEMESFLKGLQGGFIPPGPSGCPSRGQAGILPTGRNFYSIDPTILPSHSAWETGRILSEQLLDNYKKEKGQMPENIAIVIYAGDTMKTYGDDIAEVLWLYGVRPVWLSGTERVIGLEMIPLRELGRPRIDVTLRISGLFRDTFPNLIERIEDAVNLVAALEEPEEKNYVRKHIKEELRRLEKEGMGRKQAWEQASARIFGCPPGNYGAGVDTCIESRKWKNKEELGEAYSNWSSYVYGRSHHGDKWQDAFERRMASCEVAVKNIPSVESDILDDDDYYIYYGGMIRTIKNESNHFPKAYSVDVSNPACIRTRTIQEDIGRIMQARILNPAWMEGLKIHGYRGASEIAQMVDIVFGWDATGEIIEDWMYEGITDLYIRNQENRSWMEKENPWALQSVSGRLLEAINRDMWNAKAESLELLRQIYLEMEGVIEDEGDRFGV